jgi:hypothetical protein
MFTNLKKKKRMMVINSLRSCPSFETDGNNICIFNLGHRNPHSLNFQVNEETTSDNKQEFEG